MGTLPLREILERLRSTYCRSIGVQFMHIDDLFVRHWLQERMEGTGNRVNLGRAEQIRILTTSVAGTISGWTATVSSTGGWLGISATSGSGTATLNVTGGNIRLIAGHVFRNDHV